MRGVTVAVLGVVTAVAVVGAGLVVSGRQPATSLARGQKLFAGLDARLAAAQTIEIAKQDGKFVLARRGDQWVVPDKSDYPAKADMVRKALVALAELETIDAKTRNPELYGRLNLQEPTAAESKATQITVKDGQNGVIAALLVGKKRTPPASAAGSGGGEMVYVRKVGDPQTWLASGSIELRDAAIDWAQREVIDLAADKIASVELGRPAGAAAGPGFAVLREKPEDKDLKIRDMPANKAVKSQWDVNAIAGVLEGLTFDDVAKEGSVPVGAATATDKFRTKDGLTVTLTMLPKDGDTWVKVEAAGDGEAAAQAKEIGARTAGWLYKLPDYKRDKLLAKLEDLLQDPPKPQS